MHALLVPQAAHAMVWGLLHHHCGDTPLAAMFKHNINVDYGINGIFFF